MKNENAMLPRIIDSILGTVPVVGSGMQNAYDAWRQKNINIARDVVLKNVRQGDVEQLHQDQFFSMMARFSRSVHEGAAKSNLVLLARLITGIGHADKDQGKAETFNQYANMLENLSWAEMVFLSRCIKAGEVISGSSEIKQILYQKGFFVQHFDTTILNNKGVTNQPSALYFGDLYKHIPSMEITSPYSVPNFNSGWPYSLEPSEQQENNKNVPYKVDIDVKYEFSSRFWSFLQKYGNLWEDISKESGDDEGE